jgi:hypothetical protein
MKKRIQENNFGKVANYEQTRQNSMFPLNTKKDMNTAVADTKESISKNLDLKKNWKQFIRALVYAREANNAYIVRNTYQLQHHE